MKLLPHILQNTHPDLMRVVLLAMGMPLLSFLVFVFFGKKLPKGRDWMAAGLLGVATLLSGWVLIQFWGELNPQDSARLTLNWMQIGDGSMGFTLGLWVDRTAALMHFLVNLITLLVHIFSQEYMKGDPRLDKYWAYLGLFSFSMLGIVLSSGLLTMFIFWELVGFSSYLLIGFWHQKKGPAAASMKAFIVNRIGDVGFLIGILIVLVHFRTTEFAVLLEAGSLWTEPGTMPAWLTLAGFCLICGALAKSAQLPLQIWLPDAMEGPTPVSSLIHAATMVAAGVFMLFRIAPLLSPEVKMTLMILGALTAFLAALSATVQTDIKRILAYSTISQLGFMVMGIAVPEYSMFHLLTHAFFKCGLFLTAGVIIHSLHHVQHELKEKGEALPFDVQDIRIMGGLRRIMPKTFVFFLVFGAALAGIPLFSGFLSKDGILLGVWAMAEKSGGIYWMMPVLGMSAALLTAYYISRLGLLVFFGENHLEGKLKEKGIEGIHLASAPLKMYLPMAVLALASFWIIWAPGSPFDGAGSWLFPALGENHLPHELHLVVALSSLVAALGGIALAWVRFGKNRNAALPGGKRGFWANLFFNHFYLDRVYARFIAGPFVWFCRQLGWFDKNIVDGAVNGAAWFAAGKDRQEQSLSGALGWFDARIIDGIVNRVAGVVMRLGQAALKVQPGKVQLLLVFTVAAVLLLLLYLFYFAAG
ncbi:MAG: NADH-quinone oxidoreductase subunit L [Bacteroidia bacterium]|nr:NADH-quinone oxidoreductase subunit L [Bacteroidia bacterium]